METLLSKLDDVVFDPRIITEDETTSRSIWTSESVALADKGMRDGYRLRDTPYLATIRGYNIRKANISFRYSDDELLILRECMADKVYYANNFGQLKDAQKGWTNIKLRSYQENLLSRYSNNRWNIIMFPRQSGKTTTTIIEIAHYVTFSIDKDCVVIAQSDKVVNEILGKFKEFISKIPYFLQPGCVSVNKNGFVFENGCRLTVGIASESVVQGFSLDLLYVDEFAYIKPSLVNKFWENIYPSLTNNPESRCIITSTPTGRNMFYTMWTNAIKGDSKFVPYRIYWQDVPGRDEKFREDTISIVGITGWLMGFECSFDAQLKSIFTSTIQIKLRDIQQSMTPEMFHIDNQIEWIDKSIVDYNINSDFFVISIDIAEGLEQNASTMKINKIDWSKENKRLEFHNVGTYENNKISVGDYAQFILDTVLLFNQSNIRVVIENNTYGAELFAHIDNLRYNSGSQTSQVLYKYGINKASINKYSTIDNVVFAKFERASKDNDFERGIRWNKTNKPIGVKAFSNLITEGIMHEYHINTIEQYLNFGRQKNGSYMANYGFDDLVMAQVTASYFITINNMYSVDFLTFVENELRERAFDVDEAILLQRAAKKKEEESKFVWRGFTQKRYLPPIKNELEQITLYS
jgi:hypothetical protein